ncbi:ribosomal RNA-processing protein 7-domain-containing protein [Aspergillus varians]
MKKDLEIAGYIVLPLNLPTTPSFPTPATHYLYLRAHEPRIPDPDTPRSLFLVNIPIDTTETHLRHLFGTQLSSGRVERVDFESARTGKKNDTLVQGTTIAKSKKRKRVTADELETMLDEVSLPSTWDRPLQHSGSHAVVVFVDKASMEASLKAAKKASRKSSTGSPVITWGEGIDESRVPELGLQRYISHQRACYPPRAELLRAVNEYMNVFTEVAEVRKREASRRVAEPDEDGFVTVTSGPRLTSAAGEEEAKRLIEKQKKKFEGFGDFYRFQSREKRKERQIHLLKQFDEDKKKLAELKLRKGKIRPE